MFILPVLLSPCPCTRPVRLIKSGLDLLLDLLLLLLRGSFARTTRSVRSTSCALLGVLLGVILLPCPSSCAWAVCLLRFCLRILVLLRCQPISIQTQNTQSHVPEQCLTLEYTSHFLFCLLCGLFSTSGNKTREHKSED